MIEYNKESIRRFIPIIAILLIIVGITTSIYIFTNTNIVRDTKRFVAGCTHQKHTITKDPTQRGWNNPIIMDLNQNGISVTTRNQGVFFDIDNDGFLEKTKWISNGDAFLVLDENKNGQIDSQKEIFGGKVYGDYYPGGHFKQLQRYDLNKDCTIDMKDPVWLDLRLWVDKNHNGFTDVNELQRLYTHNINEISVYYETKEEAQNIWKSYKKSDKYKKYDLKK